jgi:hypothetical protein
MLISHEHSSLMSMQVALTEYWAQKHKDAELGFYSVHPGWVDSGGLKKSMQGFHAKYVDSYSLTENSQYLRTE